MAAADEAVGGQRDRVRVERPERQADVHEQRVRSVHLLRQAAKPAEEHGEERVAASGWMMAHSAPSTVCL